MRNFDNVALTETERDVLNRMRRIVAEQGRDFIDTARAVGPTGLTHCAYFEGDKPSCLIGHLLNDMRLQHTIVGAGNYYSINHVVMVSFELQRKFSPVLVAAMGRAQILQDEKQPWGEALDAFEETLYEQTCHRTKLTPEPVVVTAKEPEKIEELSSTVFAGPFGVYTCDPPKIITTDNRELVSV